MADAKWIKNEKMQSKINAAKMDVLKVRQSTLRQPFSVRGPKRNDALTSICLSGIQSRNFVNLKASIGLRNSELNRSLPPCLHPCPISGRLARAVWLFLRAASRLVQLRRAFSSSQYAFSATRPGRGYPAMPCQTTGTLEAPGGCSFRTYPPFPSVINTSNRYRPNWLTPFWTQLTSPFNPWTPAPLDAAAHPGEEEPTATPQHAGSICSSHWTGTNRRVSVNSFCKARPILEWTLVLMFQTRSCLSPCFWVWR